MGEDGKFFPAADARRVFGTAIESIPEARGVTLFVGRLVDVRPLELADVVPAHLGTEEEIAAMRRFARDPELFRRKAEDRWLFVRKKNRAGVEVRRRRYAWVVEDVRKCAPFPVGGSLGLFDVEDWLVDRALADERRS